MIIRTEFQKHVFYPTLLVFSFREYIIMIDVYEQKYPRKAVADNQLTK